MKLHSPKTVCEVCGREFSDSQRSETHPDFCETCVRSLFSETSHVPKAYAPPDAAGEKDVCARILCSVCGRSIPSPSSESGMCSTCRASFFSEEISIADWEITSEPSVPQGEREEKPTADSSSVESGREEVPREKTVCRHAEKLEGSCTQGSGGIERQLQKEREGDEEADTQDSLLNVCEKSWSLFRENIDHFISLGLFLGMVTFAVLIGSFYALRTLIYQKTGTLIGFDIISIKELYEVLKNPELAPFRSYGVMVLLGGILIASWFGMGLFRVMHRLVKDGEFRYGYLFYGRSMFRGGVAMILLLSVLTTSTLGAGLLGAYLRDSAYEEGKQKKPEVFSRYEEMVEKKEKAMAEEGFLVCMGYYLDNGRYFFQDYAEASVAVHLILNKDIRYVVTPYLRGISLLLGLYFAFCVLWVVPILMDRRLGLFDAFEASWQFNHEDMIKMLALIGILVGVGLLITAFGVGIGFFFFFPFAVLVLMVRYMLRTEQPIAVPHSARYREKAMA